MTAPLAARALDLWRALQAARRRDLTITFPDLQRANHTLRDLRNDDHPLIRSMAGVVPVRIVERHGGDAA